MLAKSAFSLLAFVLLTGALSAQPDPKKVDDKALITKVYNLKPLLGERGKASGVADADAVIKVIFEAIPQLRDLKPGGDGPQIVERDGGKLEVRATAKRHEEIKDLLDALERLQDLAIDVKADVIELDAPAYEKLLTALPKASKGKAPVLYATGAEIEGKDGPAIDAAMRETNKILKAGRAVQTSSGRFVNGAEATVSARRTVVTYYPTQGEAKKPQGQLQSVKDGFGLSVFPVVSADRRFVRIKLTEQSTILHELKTREVRGFGDRFEGAVVSADISDVGVTGSAVVADGGTLLFRLAYAPKDKVWVVVLRPTIFIQAEEDEIKKQEKK